MNKPKPPTYNFDKAVFVSAVDRLSIAQVQNKEASGHDALVSAYIDRWPRFYHKLGPVYISPELNDYYRNLGQYVELAVELNMVVDQQR
jgi:hypothetical protein